MQVSRGFFHMIIYIFCRMIIYTIGAYILPHFFRRRFREISFLSYCSHVLKFCPLIAFVFFRWYRHSFPADTILMCVGKNRNFSIQEQDKEVKLQIPLKINPSIDPMVPSATLSQLSGKGELPYECGGASCLLSVGRVVF